MFLIVSKISETEQGNSMPPLCGGYASTKFSSTFFDFARAHFFQLRKKKILFRRYALSRRRRRSVKILALVERSVLSYFTRKSHGEVFKNQVH